MPTAPHAPLKFRGFYADDQLWHDAQDEAAARGETVSEALRRSLKRYTRARRHARTNPTTDRTDP